MTTPTTHTFSNVESLDLDIDRAGYFYELRYHTSHRPSTTTAFPHFLVWEQNPSNPAAIGDTLTFDLGVNTQPQSLEVVDILRQVRPGFPNQHWYHVYVRDAANTTTPNH